MEYDVIIVGASTSGAYLARNLARRGLSVLVLEKDGAEKVGSKMDIFHIAENEFEKLGLPRVRQGDEEWAFEFEENYVASPTGQKPVPSFSAMVGLHMHAYVLLMNKRAEREGARIEYSTAFEDFIWENGKIAGVTAKKEENTLSFYGKIVVDCSGIGAVCRMKLPSSFHMDERLTENDLFYVILRYAEFAGGKPVNIGWPSHKAWIAPSGRQKGGIIGIGACHSFAYAEKMYEKLCSMVALPEHKVVFEERGVTPFTRPPYSFVGDRFVCCGDAAYLTKPNNGEGVTSSMVQLVIVENVIVKAITADDRSAQKLWEINTEYNKTQGADFAFLRAVLVKAVRANDKEFEYFFKKGILFNEKMMKCVNTGDIRLSFSDIMQTIFGILSGLFTGKIRFSTIGNVLGGLLLGIKLKKKYINYPSCPEKLPSWVQKTDKLWEKVGKMS